MKNTTQTLTNLNAVLFERRTEMKTEVYETILQDNIPFFAKELSALNNSAEVLKDFERMMNAAYQLGHIDGTENIEPDLENHL